MTEDLQHDDTEVQNLKARLQAHNTSPPKRRCRGSAKGIEFEKLRRIGRKPIRVKDNARGASCDYSHIFAERCTYIVKHFANLGHKSWMHVPKEDKEELYAHVVGYFVLDWN